MSEYLIKSVKLEEWTADQLATYLRDEKGIKQDYTEMFAKHQISGKVAYRLTDQDLKDVGITTVGDRLEIMHALEGIRKAQQQRDNEAELWSGDEVLYTSCWNRACTTCCGCCPDDPSHYKLTRTQLEIKSYENFRCGPCICNCCCCPENYHLDLVDISNVKDVDVRGMAPATCCDKCCCGPVQEHVYIKTNDGKPDRILKLEKGDGEKAARTIRAQVEFCQRMERS